MKKGFFVILLSFCHQAFAQFPITNIENFTGNYAEPSGEATATNFSYETINFGKNPVFTVERQAGFINLRTPDKEFTWENPPAFIDELNTLNWQNIRLNSDDNHFSLNVPRFNGNSDEASFSTSNLSLNCAHAGNQYQDLASELLDACLNNSADLSTSAISFSNARGTTLSRLNFDIRKNKLNFSVNVGVTVKGDGQVWYEHGNKMIRIKIDRAKAGFLNVRGKLFNELKALESNKIRVHEPWIEIEL